MVQKLFSEILSLHNGMTTSIEKKIVQILILQLPKEPDQTKKILIINIMTGISKVSM